MSDHKTKTTPESASGSWLDNIIANSRLRMEVKKTQGEYDADQIAWAKLSDHQKEGWIPPDWYRSETDEEFRTRLKARIDASQT
jgi:hypothetical protein